MTAEAAGAAQPGFTVIFCTGTHCRSHLPVREMLGTTVRGCPHGMSVGTACLSGLTGCHGDASPGPLLLVQRCTGTDRRPSGPTRVLGPLRSHRDLAMVCRWLADPDTDLPLRLDPAARRAAAARN
ncbi:MAG TPA: hypothetical protein VHV82_05630 [Sporichthyaceae bacterium]|jgi:hypothetical protein|nr:hypothetical protein [Sporichthyaceae bacterium]